MITPAKIIRYFSYLQPSVLMTGFGVSHRRIAFGREPRRRYFAQHPAFHRLLSEESLDLGGMPLELAGVANGKNRMLNYHIVTCLNSSISNLANGSGPDPPRLARTILDANFEPLLRDDICAEAGLDLEAADTTVAKQAQRGSPLNLINGDSTSCG